MQSATLQLTVMQHNTALYIALYRALLTILSKTGADFFLKRDKTQQNAAKRGM